MMQRQNPALVALCRQGTEPAVDAWVHRNDPDSYHRRLPHGVACDRCPGWLEKMRELAEGMIDLEQLKKLGITVKPEE
jgi:hypothetical protein